MTHIKAFAGGVILNVAASDGVSEGIAAMPIHSKLLIVVADGEHARFVRPGPDNALHSEAALDSVAAHKRSEELGSDRPGASYHTGSPAHHAETPRHDLHAMEKQSFARLIGEQLNAAGERGEFDELVLVALPHTEAAIRAELNSEINARIAGTVHKDLVKTPDEKLQPHLRKWVHPVRRENRAGA